jgi:hypothetical protein
MQNDGVEFAHGRKSNNILVLFEQYTHKELYSLPAYFAQNCIQKETEWEEMEHVGASSKQKRLEFGIFSHFYLVLLKEEEKFYWA